MTATRMLIGQALLSMLLIAAAVWAGTAYVAGVFRYDAALGRPWAVVMGRPVYYPWRLFEWWYAYEAYAPDVFFRGGAIAASGGVASIFAAVAGSVARARQEKRAVTYGSARWANEKDVAKAGLLGCRGVFLGRFGNSWLRHDGPEHVMAFAPTRTGKGVGLVVPTLLSWTGSAIIHDIKGENWNLTAGWRSRFSHCLRFDPTDPASARCNPLMEVRRGDHEVRDVQNIADILVDPEGARQVRNHWEKTSYDLLVAVLLHVLYAEEEKTLARAATVLADPSRSFEETLEAMMATNHLGTQDAPAAHPAVASGARAALNREAPERSSVLSSALSYLTLFRDPIVARVTSASDWRIDDFKGAQRPVSLYLVVPPSDLSRTRPLFRLMLNQIGRRLTEQHEARHGGNRRRVLMMLDEFPALGRLDFFETALAFMAGYGVKAYLIAQSLNQIDKAYGANNSILDNCHMRVAFAPNDERAAKRISDALGTMTERRTQKNFAGHRLHFWLSHLMVSRQETSRPLMTPGEVAQLPADEAIVFAAGAPPIRAGKLRYYEEAAFAPRIVEAPASARAAPPPARPDPWTGRAAAVDERLRAPGRANARGGAASGRRRGPEPMLSRDADADSRHSETGEREERRSHGIDQDAVRNAAVLDTARKSILPDM